MNALTSSKSYLPKFSLLILCCSSVLCQHSFSSSPDEICPGDNVTFTCVLVDPDGDSFTTWTVTLDGEDDCVLRHNRPNEVETCGPGQLFTSSFTNQSGDNYTSTLRVESISDDLNRTEVECEDTAMAVGKENICIIDDTSLDSQSISASVSVPDLCDNTACMVNVRWSEPFVSCRGSVSHYVLSVTPPTPDCQSGSGGSGSELMTTQYNLTVTADQTYIFNISVINICGDIGEPAEYIIDIGGVTTTCDYNYVYSISGHGIDGITITWHRVYVLNAEADYRIVIISNETVFNDSLMFNCTGDSCSYTFLSDGITDSSSVAVEVVGCVTDKIECTNTSSGNNFLKCDPSDLLHEPVSEDCSNGLCVEFSGTSVGDIATYFTISDYCINSTSGLIFTRECLDTGLWSGNVPIKLIVCDDLRLERVHIILIAIGAIIYINGMCLANGIGVVLFKKASSYIDVALAVAILVTTGVISFPLTIVLFSTSFKKKVFIKIWYQTLIVVAVVITILSFIMWLIMIIYISTHDFCDNDNFIRGDNSVCESPSGDNGARTGLVVGSLLSSVLVLLVWIILVPLWSCGVIEVDGEENNRTSNSTPAAMPEKNNYTLVTPAKRPEEQKPKVFDNRVNYETDGMKLCNPIKYRCI